MKKILRKKRVWVLMVILVVITSVNSCMTLRKSDRAIIKIFSKKNVEPIIHRIKVQGSNMRYIEVSLGSGQNKPVIVFVHGAPGSSDNFYDYLTDSSLYNHAVLIAIDRLGYGYSDLGHAITSLDGQSECLVPILNKYPNRKVILVGHSYGGPVIARYAMNHPDDVDVLMFLAPAIDPQHEKIFWIAHLGKVVPFRWLAPASFRVAADEKFSHVNELKKMEGDWAAIKSRVIYIHGKKDAIVPFENYAFAQKKMKHLEMDSVAIENENHFLPWSQEGLIKSKLQNEISRLESL